MKRIISILTAILWSALCIAQQKPLQPSWKLQLLGPQGETPEYTPMYAREVESVYGEDGSFSRTVWNITLDRNPDCEVVVVMKVEGELPVWGIHATLPDGWIVTSVDFPIFKVDRPEGSTAILPMGYGAEFPIPENGGRLETRYPSVTGGMEFVMTHSPEGCWYFAATDEEGCGKYFYISGTGTQLTFTQHVPTSYAWTRGGKFELPWFTTFAYSPDTWDEVLLRWYRPFALECSWASTPLTERNIVPWVRNADVWIRPKNMFPEVIDGVRKAVRYYDKGLGIHWYHWHHHAYDTMYPEYFPPKPGFKEMVAEVQKAGAHVTPYINGRLWDPANDSYKTRHGYEASCRKADGSLYTEIYPTSNVPNTVTCPASEIWQQILHENPDRLLHEVGTHGVYIDQIGAAASEPCYATNHGHAPGAGGWWPQAYREALTDIRATVTGPDEALTTEENAEPYLDLFDMYLIVNTPHSKAVRMLPVFPLIYSDRVVYSGLNYYHQEINDGHFLYNNGRSLLWGAQLGWIQPDWLFAPGCEVEQEFLRTLGRFRAKNHDIFYGGRFLKELRLEGDIPEFTVLNDETFPTVMAAKWLTVKGKEAIVIVNMGGHEANVTLPDGRKARVKPYSALRK